MVYAQLGPGESAIIRLTVRKPRKGVMLLIMYSLRLKFPEKGIILNIETPYLIIPGPAISIPGQETVPGRHFLFILSSKRVF